MKYTATVALTYIGYPFHILALEKTEDNYCLTKKIYFWKEQRAQ